MWSEVGSILTWFYGTCFLATVIVLAFLFNPKYIVYGFFRFQCLKLGIRKKKLELSNNFSFSYIEKGSRNSAVSTVLLIHGLTGCKENYLALLNHLPRTFHVVAVDLFGHGETSVDENQEYSVPTYVDYLKKFVDMVGLSTTPFHLVGISFGGHVAGMYSVAHAQDLISLTLMCPQGICFEREKQMIEEARRTNTFILMPQTEEEYGDLIRLTQHKPRDIPKWLLTGLFQIRREKEAIYMEILKGLYEPHSMHLLEKNLDKIHVPLLIVWGKEDKIIDLECLQTIKDKLHIPPRKVVLLENVGHAINFERPRKLSFILLEFFNSFLVFNPCGEGSIRNPYNCGAE